MVVQCSVLKCENNFTKESKRKFFRFPIINPLRKHWIKATGRTDWTPGANDLICSDHFKPEDFDRSKTTFNGCLKRLSVPKLNLPGIPNVEFVSLPTTSSTNPPPSTKSAPSTEKSQSVSSESLSTKLNRINRQNKLLTDDDPDDDWDKMMEIRKPSSDYVWPELTLRRKLEERERRLAAVLAKNEKIKEETEVLQRKAKKLQRLIELTMREYARMNNFPLPIRLDKKSKKSKVDKKKATPIKESKSNISDVQSCDNVTVVRMEPIFLKEEVLH